MAESVLLRFLNRGLINVGGDDAKLQKLQAAAQQIAELLKKSPAKVPSFCLIAFDPEAPGNDPVIVEVLGILKDLWQTYANTFASTPVQVLRAMILDALVSAAMNDDRVAVAVAASARNILPFMETGSEAGLWSDVVQEVENLVDRRAEAEWSTPGDIDLSPLTVAQAPPVNVGNTVVEVNRPDFLQKLQTAAQTNAQNMQYNPAGWAVNFVTSLVPLLADQLDSISENAKVESVDLAGPLKQLGSEVSSYVSSAMKAFSSATLGLQRRTNLIWWKQSLYSPSKHQSYRSFPRTIAAGLMALDLYQQIPVFSPASVSYFLEEAVHSLPVEAEISRPLKDLVREASESPELGVLREEAARLFAAPDGRSPLLALVGHPSALQSTDDLGLAAFIGVSLDQPLSDVEWAGWIFRDLQAGRATKEQPKKKSGKGTA